MSEVSYLFQICEMSESSLVRGTGRVTASFPYRQGRKFHLTVGGDNKHKISQEQFLKGTQIIQPKLYL